MSRCRATESETRKSRCRDGQIDGRREAVGDIVQSE